MMLLQSKKAGTKLEAPGLLLLLFVCLLLVSCSDSSRPAVERARRLGRSQGPVTVGIADCLPAERSQLARGIKLAAAEIRSRGILKRRLKLVWANDQSSVTRGLQIAQSFADNPDICAVIGHCDSYVSVPAAIIYQYYGILMLSPLSTSCRLTARNLSLVFATIPNARAYGRALAEFCRNNDLKRILILQVDNEYGNSLANSFERECQRQAVEVVDRAVFDPLSSRNMIREKFRFWRQNHHLDALFVVAEMPAAARIVVDARAVGIDTPILGGDCFDDPDLIRKAGRAAEGVIVPSAFWLDETQPQEKKFAKKFIECYGLKPDFVAAQGYSTMMVLAQALAKAEPVTSKMVSQALKREPKWRSLISFGFNPDGSVKDAKFFFKVVQNGKFVLFSEKDAIDAGRKPAPGVTRP